MIKHLIGYKRDMSIQHYKNCADLKSFDKFYRDCPVARKVKVNYSTSNISQV